MGGLLGKVVLELTVEEVFNVGLGAEVELKVVEDCTTEGDELVDQAALSIVGVVDVVGL